MPAGSPHLQAFPHLKMNDTETEFQKLQEEIRAYLPFEEFIRIEKRLEQLRGDEENKLLALRDLQKAYLSANSDFEQNYVKEMVAKIREMSKIARTEIRSLNQIIVDHNLTLEMARNLYEKVKALGGNL